MLNELTEWQRNGNGWIKRVEGDPIGTFENPVFDWICISSDEESPYSTVTKFYVLFGGKFDFLQSIWQNSSSSKITEGEKLKEVIDQFLIRMNNLLPFV